MTLTRRTAVALLGGGVLAGCAALPRSGPTTEQIVDDEDGAARDGLVVDLDAAALALIAPTAIPGFPDAFRTATAFDAERLGPGDVVDLTIWESGETALLGDARPARIEGARIGPDGRLFVPFAGPQRAAGATPAQLSERIASALAPLTLQPQVSVRLREPMSRMVTVQGAVGAPGAYPIEAITARLAPALAVAGGVTLPPEQAEITLRRGGAMGAEMLEDVFADPALDVALRPGDVITVAALRARFIALGATGVQAEVPFPTRRLDLMSALAAARGLRDFDANATGLFVFRYEPPAVADALLQGPAPQGLPPGPGRPVIYRVDFSQPEGLFLARGFAMRDDDMLFATNAPLTELRKLIQVFTAVLTPVQQGATIAP